MSTSSESHSRERERREDGKRGRYLGQFAMRTESTESSSLPLIKTISVLATAREKLRWMLLGRKRSVLMNLQRVFCWLNFYEHQPSSRSFEETKARHLIWTAQMMSDCLSNVFGRCEKWAEAFCLTSQRICDLIMAFHLNQSQTSAYFVNTQRVGSSL